MLFGKAYGSIRLEKKSVKCVFRERIKDQLSQDGVECGFRLVTKFEDHK